MKTYELVVSPCNTENARFLNIFKWHPKYGKQHLMAENSYHLREMIEQCSRCSLPTGSGTSDQKSENVKSCVTPMPINFIVGPTGPNNPKKIIPDLDYVSIYLICSKI